MFGYVVADRSTLTEEEILRYQSCYCGLCRVIGEQYGTLQRAALNYDMTFLVLLLSSLYEPQEYSNSRRCSVHPFRSRCHWNNETTAYAAAMNMALAYHNCMDDWHDERKLRSLTQAKLFARSKLEAEHQYPRQCSAIEQCIQTLSEIEAADIQEPDAGANAFGALMGQLFVWKDDRWSPLLRQLGENLGRFIYLADALNDLALDVKKGAYNPFRDRYVDGLDLQSYLPVLRILMGECTDAFERLPLLQDLGLLRNILYSGVWVRLNQRHTGKEEHHV